MKCEKWRGTILSGCGWGWGRTEQLRALIEFPINCVEKVEVETFNMILHHIKLNSSDPVCKQISNFWIPSVIRLQVYRKPSVIWGLLNYFVFQKTWLLHLSNDNEGLLKKNADEGYFIKALWCLIALVLYNFSASGTFS